FLLQGSFQDALHSSSTVAYLTTVATALLFFGSLIVHELGHAFEARREGIEVTRIELFLFGGTTYMARDAKTPGEEFRISIAGPLGTLFFLVVCAAVDLAIVGSHRLWHAILLDGTVRITPVLMSLSWLVLMNVLILIFNLVPAYPLDGGRIARAVVWRITGDKLRGTRASARLGEGFAVVMATVGLWLALTQDGFDGAWLMLLAFMIWQSARMALGGTAAAQRVQGVRVADIMDHEPVVVPGTATVERALDEFFLRYNEPWLPVVDDDGYFIGIARRERAQEHVDHGERSLTVGAILESDAREQLQVQETQPLTDVLQIEALGRLGAVVAVDAHGLLRGVLTVDQVRRVLETVLAAPAPS
ncbi:MAG TPA: site-2 protease family protein, partial [Solirubrobacteraceae bacterium]|nr:site-2 protease family protein [Solirubrobacteraceae bacterium]